MFKFKKVLALVVIMAITAISFITSVQADEASTTAKLITSYTDDGQYLIVSLSTSTNCGAIKASLTYTDSAMTYVKTDKMPEDHTADDSVNATAGKVDFVFVGDVNNGTSEWADFYFTVKSTATVDFNLTDAQVCTVGEVLADTSISPASKTVSVDPLQTLGAQIRSDSNETYQNLRFGSKIIRTINNSEDLIKVGSNDYAVKSCGYLVAIKSNLSQNEQMTIDSANTKVVKKETTRSYMVKSDYLIYTMVVTKITNDLLDTEIAIRPYIVYNNGGKDVYMYGEQIARSVNEVENSLFK